MSTFKNNDSCQHDEYCGFSKTVCVETDFKEKCLMKDTSVEQMPLLKKVKERVERDTQRRSYSA
ncbi:hypothetical protein [Sulfurimonas sp.]|uniref:hypothetical protein n=1 Tax=Sulfurimonas sp. TaxID=2022749 RepID=UPI00356977F2